MTCAEEAPDGKDKDQDQDLDPPTYSSCTEQVTAQEREKRSGKQISGILLLALVPLPNAAP